MVTCRQATELMTDEREGKLEGARARGYRIHMFICGHCRAYRRQLGVTIDASRGVPREEVPPAALDELVAAFRARRGRPGPDGGGGGG